MSVHLTQQEKHWWEEFLGDPDAALANASISKIGGEVWYINQLTALTGSTTDDENCAIQEDIDQASGLSVVMHKERHCPEVETLISNK